MGKVLRIEDLDGRGLDRKSLTRGKALRRGAESGRSAALQKVPDKGHGGSERIFSDAA